MPIEQADGSNEQERQAYRSQKKIRWKRTA
jgi:hypothetical protein